MRTSLYRRQGSYANYFQAYFSQRSLLGSNLLYVKYWKVLLLGLHIGKVIKCPIIHRLRSLQY